MNKWQRKLLAYLHDPPSKPFNIAEHWSMAESLIRNAGFEPAEVAWFFDKVCDHTAAAADRVICPKSSALQAGWDAMSAFKHPLGGGELRFDQPINPTEAETQVGNLQPHTCDWSKVSPEAEKQDWARFFVHWRLWRQRCAEKHPSLAHLPADTRIPDHTIWTHCSIVSALQACVQFERKGDAVENREFKPAFLLVQIGPVQEFIAQARSTRDLWSGSYLLSWLIAHGIKAITDEVGPDCVLFPALRGQPLFDFLHKESLYDKLAIWSELRHSQEQILTPNLPNRFLAVVPEWQAEQLALAAEKAMKKELQGIADKCATWLKVETDALPRWNQQIAQFLTVHWQAWKWQENVAEAITGHEQLQRVHQAATKGIPAEHLDPRNYKHKSWPEGGVWKSEILPGPDGIKPFIENPGFAWAAHYKRVDELLAARRNTRDFDLWDWEQHEGENVEDALKRWLEREKTRNGAVKDMLSGKEEVIGSEEWQQELPGTINGHHFKKDEKLGAINLIKRIWHRAYLEVEEGPGLKRTPRFDSLPAVAAATYSLKTVDSLRDKADRWASFLAFQKAATAAREVFGAAISSKCDETAWRENTDASVFHVSEWERAIKDAKTDNDRKLLIDTRDALRKLGGCPSRYVAVLAMDGDSMGEWVSGAKSPHWRSQLAAEAVAYFREQGDKLAELLDTPRHVSPSYHLQLSEALGNFALYLAGPIVECHDGQLIYAGGDDVLAMLPAENALKCARALRMTFKGDPNLWKLFDPADQFDENTSPSPVLPGRAGQDGFVTLNGKAPIFQRTKRFVPRGYPLIVPGHNADISAGIAIGHMHSPLQNLVEAARQAEKRAKKDEAKGGYGKSAFAISLFKRSGETIQWGAKWDSKAIDLATDFTKLTENEQLSAQFPYALARLLRAYAIGNDFKIAKNNGFDPFDVFPAEFAHCVQQQGQGVPDSFKESAEEYLGQCKNRRLDDFLGPFLTTTFINRGGGE